MYERFRRRADGPEGVISTNLLSQYQRQPNQVESKWMHWKRRTVTTASSQAPATAAPITIRRVEQEGSETER